MSFAPVLHAGATIAIGRKFSTSQFWHDIHRHNASVIQYVGETCRYLLNAPPAIDPKTGVNLDRAHRVRLAYGNGLRPDVWKRFKDRFNIDTIIEFYGATEGMMMLFNRSRNDFSAGAVGRVGWSHRNTVGRTLLYLEVDPDTDMPVRNPKTGLCKRVKLGQTGELCFKLPDKNLETRFQGYYGDEGATKKKILRDVVKKGDAWFRTGDLLRMDSEGRVYFSDRIGDTFRWKSENVSTAEVAQAVGLHPAVREANVYGVQVPHHEGRAGAVALVLDANEAEKVDATLRSLAQHVRKSLPRYALPLFLRVAKETGTNSTGTNKQQKNILRQQGITPGKVGDDQLFWLRGDTYAKFSQKDWDELNGGRIKL
jgi:acyl-CoA synthetase (AMP-forming)/AMP-acid ligase II